MAVAVAVLGLSLALYHRTWARPFSTLIGGAGDADEYTWFLAWVPYAIGHGLNPLVSTYVNSPHGINLMWNTSVLLPSFLLSPLTVIFGTAFSYNVAITVAPVLNATFAYMAFRRWTRPLPALAGAAFFAFSPYMASQSGGHLAQVLIMSAPLILVLGDRLLVVQAGKAWLDGLLLGLLAWAQLLTGEEILAMEVIIVAIAVGVLALVSRHQVASRSPYARQGCIVGAGTFALLSAPFLACQFFGPYRVENVHPASVYASDLLNFFVPTRFTQFAPAAALRVSSHFRGTEHSAYIGIPIALFLIVALVLARHRQVAWVALAGGLAAAVLSMGPTLRVLGHNNHIPLPGDALAHLPVLKNLLPNRFASMITLGVALLLALGLDELKRLRPLPCVLGCVLAGLGLVTVFPTVHYPNSAAPILRAFYTGWACPSARGRGAAPGRPEVAMVIPADDEVDLRWQAQANFCFAMPTDTGMTGTNSAYRKGQGVLYTVGVPTVPMPPLTAATRAQAAQEISQLGITEIIVAPQSPAVPNWSWADQARAVAWVEQLLGQVPQKSYDVYHSYVWKSLPPTVDIASGTVPTLPARA